MADHVATYALEFQAVGGERILGNERYSWDEAGRVASLWNEMLWKGEIRGMTTDDGRSVDLLLNGVRRVPVEAPVTIAPFRPEDPVPSGPGGDLKGVYFLPLPRRS